MKKFILLAIVAISLTSCAGIRRTYNIRGEAEKVKFEYTDSVQQFPIVK